MSQGTRSLDQLTEALAVEGRPSRSTIFRRIEELRADGWLIDIPADLGGGVALGANAYNLYLRELQSRRAEAVRAAERLDELIAGVTAPVVLEKIWRPKFPICGSCTRRDPAICSSCLDASNYVQAPLQESPGC